MTPGSGEAEGEDTSQWTRIVRKGKAKKLGRQQQPAQPPPAGPPENFRPNPSPKLLADDIRAEHQGVSSKWRGTACYERLSRLVKVSAASHAPIRKAICLGLGAFDPEDGSWVAQRRSHSQLAAFLTVVEVLEQESGGKIRCFYQEPRFAQPDKDFISSLGGTVVESPDSYDLVDESTLVYGIHLYRDIWAAALEKSLPGMFIGTGWQIWEERPGAEESSDFDRIREMDTAFDNFPFPQDEYNSFSSTCVYWRKRDVELRADAQPEDKGASAQHDCLVEGAAKATLGTEGADLESLTESMRHLYTNGPTSSKG